MACSLAAILAVAGYAGAQEANGQYKVLRGQTMQLKKPANQTDVRPETPAPDLVVPAPITPQTPVIAIPTAMSTPPVIQPVALPQSQLETNKPADPKVGAKDPPKDRDLGSAASDDYKVKTTLPSREELFRIESEKQIFRRIESERPSVAMTFPKDTLPLPAAALGTFPTRAFDRSQMVAEANYVCHGKLLFEQRNAERYGWDLGFIQPAVCLGVFLKDVAFLPYHVASRPCKRECSPRCLPGDSVPFMWYHEGFTMTGFLAEAGVAVAIFAVIP